MRLIRPNFEIWAASGHPELPHNYDEGADRLVEAAGRVCYKSEDKIWDKCPRCGGLGEIEPTPYQGQLETCPVCDGGRFKSSAEKFIEMLNKRGHFSVLEHSWHVGITGKVDWMSQLWVGPEANYLKHVAVMDVVGGFVIAGNWRAVKESGLIEIIMGKTPRDNIDPADLPAACAMTVHFTVDRGVSHEIVRHRPASYSQESTRYCDYGGGDVVFVVPPWIKTFEAEYHLPQPDPPSILEPNNYKHWINAMWHAEQAYHALRQEGWSPQQARSVLPNSLKTEVVMTASLAEWQHVFRLRCSAAAHPQMQEIMIPLQEEARKLFPGVF